MIEKFHPANDANVKLGQSVPSSGDSNDQHGLPRGDDNENDDTKFEDTNLNRERETQDQSSAEKEVYSLVRKIKKMEENDDYFFVFLWGMTSSGKTHILYTLYSLMEKIGEIVPYEDHGADGFHQRKFRAAKAEFWRCAPGNPTPVTEVYNIAASFKPNLLKHHEDYPMVNFAFIEAAGERILRAGRDVRDGNITKLPSLHTAIMKNPSAKIAHVFVAEYGSDGDEDQDTALSETLNVIQKLRGENIKKDSAYLILSKWDKAISMSFTPEAWFSKNIGNTFLRYMNLSLHQVFAFFQTYITGEWTEGESESGHKVPYASEVYLDSAHAFIHWLYKVKTGYLLFSDLEPTPLLNANESAVEQSTMQKVKGKLFDFFTINSHE